MPPATAFALTEGIQPSWLPRVLAGRYELGAEIARGGCAVILEARDRRVGRFVAVKVPKPGSFEDSAVTRLTREAQVGAAIHHPNVCAVTDAGWLEDGSPYLVMERLYGETLGAYATRTGRIEPDLAIEIALQMLAALSAAHAMGVVHRDVKPDNVFLVARHGCVPVVKLLDFGLCCRENVSHSEEVALTRAGTVVGTPEYMAPEQASGFRKFDARIDLYAVGVVLYEALTGTRAFVAGDVATVLTSVIGKSLPPLRALRPDLPLELERTVTRAMSRDPRSRFASALDFQSALLKLRDQLPRGRGASEVASAGASIAQTGEWELPTRRIVVPHRTRSA
jgi:eukaryotic-like serine/threonine-protein kinase